jgi:spermidine synthase
MTDLYDEWWTQRRAIEEARRRGGNVLITGLGLGLIVESMLRPEDSPIESVTVVERSADVIRLVAPHFLSRYGDRLLVVEADAFDWRPRTGERFSVVWHDIWPNPLDPRIFPEIDRLHRRYENFCAWQWSWPSDYLEAAGVDLLSDGTLKRRTPVRG